MDKDRIKGAAKDIKGDVKKEIGKAMGDKQMQAEGHLDKAEGKIQKEYGKLKDEMRK